MATAVLPSWQPQCCPREYWHARGTVKPWRSRLLPTAAAKAAVSAAGGMPTIIAHLISDEYELRKAATLCLANLVEGHAANAEVVADYQPAGKVGKTARSSSPKPWLLRPNQSSPAVLVVLP